VIFSVLDNELGDTDPEFEEDDTDEYIKNAEPIFWCAKTLSSLLDEKTEDK